MKQEVLQFINKHQLLRKNTTVMVGVSGGPDSLALLHLLNSMKEKWQLKLIVVSMDHQLRGEESLADLHYVRDIAKSWGIQFLGASLDVLSFKQETQFSEEVAARKLRYQFFKEQMNDFQADFLALGHHGDDQVETMLMSLTRSANSSAFSGMPLKREFGPGMIIRPLLCVTKDSILDYCEENQLIPKIDQTNFETKHTRNFFRKNLLPLIKEKNNNIHTTIQHLSETLTEDEEFLQSEALKTIKETTDLDLAKKTCTIEINLFMQRPLALQRRAFHLILNYLYDELPKDLTYIHDEHFFSLLQYDKGNARIDFPLNLKLEKSYGRLSFYFSSSYQASDGSSYFKPLDIPGEYKLPDGSAIIAGFVEHPHHDDAFSFTCNITQVALPLHIRNRRPGDKMTWKGLNGSKKLKDIFIDYKIPIRKRSMWPIVVDNNGEILWLVGLKKNYPDPQVKIGTFIQLYYDR